MAHISLSKPLRNSLQAAAMRARDIAEAGAEETLAFYALGVAKAPEHLNPDQRSFRNKLRAHARQLGDMALDNGAKAIARLVDEIAYEQWHRILFTRFLVENELLIHPEFEAPLSLADVAELAAEGDRDTWELASEFASKMLPQIFRPEDPTQQLRLPRNRVKELEQLVLELEPATFKANDSLGWSYQFWQAKRKDAINAAGGKIGAAELPAVTQLFTEDYMVEFLLQNSLGAWFKANHPDAVLDLDMPYLRFVPGTPREEVEADGSVFKKEEPAAGTFENWPTSLADFKVLDPCCGSGHFPVFLLHMLVPMRMALESLTAREAVHVVLRDNIYGLELDPRCVEIAVFALALAAWTYPGAGGYRKLPQMNIACCGLSITQKQSDWVALAGKDERLKSGMEALYASFKDAPTLGSLLDPMLAGDLFEAEFQELEPLLDTALGSVGGDGSESDIEAILIAQGLGKAARILATKFDLVATNPPYLGRGNQSDVLREFCETNYPDAKNDLANVMLERCLKLVKPESGVVQFVMPQNWLFLSSYKKQRESLLKRVQWNLLAKLGPGAFETISGEVVQAVLLTQTKTNASDDFHLRGVDVSAPKGAPLKAMLLRQGGLLAVRQYAQLRNPDARISLEEASSEALLGQYATGLQGVSTSDNPRFRLNFWELSSFDDGWCWFQGGVDVTQEFGGCDSVVWLQKLTELYETALDGANDFQASRAASNSSGVYLRGQAAWSSKGVAVRQMQSLSVCLTHSTPFDTNTAVVLPQDEAHLAAIWCFCSSPEYSIAVRRIDQKLNVTNSTLVKVPFNLDYWQKIADEKYPEGLPKPYSNDPTQWFFHGHPRRASDPLQVAVARLLGYRWPAETDPLMELSDEARGLTVSSAMLSSHADDDGIVCIPSVKGELPAADRLLTLLADAFGEEWTPSLQNELLTKAGFANKGLETWLRDGFFPQHCKLFHDRPFVWHVWDGEKDGFSALVNYHKLNKQTLSKLTHTYLGGWLEEKKKQLAGNVDGAKELVLSAQLLQNKLKLILEGDKPLDIFVRWKPLAQQPLGWEPDLNDGVRLNIRPFLLVGDVGKKGAGILRAKPNVKWTKDRGADVTSAPWYGLGPAYGEEKGARINEHHLTLEEKNKALKA